MRIERFPGVLRGGEKPAIKIMTYHHNRSSQNIEELSAAPGGREWKAEDIPHRLPDNLRAEAHLPRAQRRHDPEESRHVYLAIENHIAYVQAVCCGSRGQRRARSVDNVPRLLLVKTQMLDQASDLPGIKHAKRSLTRVQILIVSCVRDSHKKISCPI